MLEDRTEEFLGADARLAPRKIEDAGGATGHQLISEEPDDLRAHEGVDVLPVDLAGFFFDDPEALGAVRRAAAGLFKGTEHVELAGGFGGAGLDGGVVVDGDEV